MKPEDEKEEFNLTPEEEDELERRHNASIEDERAGKLIPWEAVFPPQRQTG